MNSFGFNQPFGLGGGIIRLGFGSITLAKLLYSNPFAYTLDASGNSIVTNQGSGDDMLMYSGRYLDLVNQPLPIPIHHTLGADRNSTDFPTVVWETEVGTFTAVSPSSFNIAVTTIGTMADRPAVIKNLATPLSVGDKVVVSFDIVVNSGLCKVSSMLIGGDYEVGITFTTGHYDIEYSIDAPGTFSRFYFDGRNLFSASVTNWTVKQITNPNSFLTYWNITTNTSVSLDMSTLTPSQKYRLDNIKVNNILATKNAPSAEAIVKINANPNLLGALALNNTIPELDWVLDGTQKYYAGFETADAIVYNAKNTLETATIANYTTNARKKSHNKGIQTTAFTLDAIGVPTAYDVSKFNFYSNEYANTQTNLSTVGNFWLEEVIGTTIYQHKFDGVNLTTYTNNVAGTATAHTPENVAYQLGRGVYPKLAINPLATYTVSKFNLHTDTNYTAYNQATRYTELGA